MVERHCRTVLIACGYLVVKVDSMKRKTNPRIRYTRPGNRAERYLYRGTNRYILLDEWKKRTACRIGKKRRSVFVIAKAMKILEGAVSELGVPFRELVSGTLDLYFKTRMKRGYPVFYDYKRVLKLLIPDWYYSGMTVSLAKPRDDIDEDMIDELIH